MLSAWGNGNLDDQAQCDVFRPNSARSVNCTRFSLWARFSARLYASWATFAKFQHIWNHFGGAGGGRSGARSGVVLASRRTVAVQSPSRGCIARLTVAQIHARTAKSRKIPKNPAKFRRGKIQWVGAVRLTNHEPGSKFSSWLLLAPPGSSWLLLAPPGSSRPLLAPPGSSRLLPAPPGSSRLLLAPPGSSWLLLAPPGSSWPLLAPPGSSRLLLAPPGSSWLLLAPPGSSWPLLAPPGSSSRLSLSLSGRGGATRGEVVWIVLRVFFVSRVASPCCLRLCR